MRRLWALTILTLILMAPQACTSKSDKDVEQSQKVISVPLSEITSVMYVYPVSNGCESYSMDLLFTGQDLNHPIFSTIINTPKSAFEAGAVCSNLSDEREFKEVRLKFKKLDGSQDVFVSSDIGCLQDVSPDVTGVIPHDLLVQIKEALNPKRTDPSDRYERNSIAVYYKNQRLANVDPGSFEMLGWYARDKSSVYFGGQAVEGADPNSLVLDKVNPYYAVDSKQVFFEGSLVPGLDPKGFACIDSHFCKNATQVLFRNTLVSDVDAASFGVDSCETKYQGPTSPMLCSPPNPSRPLVVCQVHDKNRSLTLEHEI